MRNISRLAAVLVAGAIAVSPAMAADKAKPVATVNGQPISQALFDARLAEQKRQGAPDSPELQNVVRNELINREVLIQEARKQGFEKSAEVQKQVELAKQGILIQAYLGDYVRKHPVSDAQLKAEYDLIKQNFGSTEFKARHILVEKEEDAKAIIAKLDKGEKFADLAKQSKDPGSRDNGGELGWSSPKAYVPPFADAMSRLKKGEYTKDPVRTDFGYHVILLDDSRPMVAPPFEQIKGQRLQRSHQQMVEQLINDLRKKATIN